MSTSFTIPKDPGVLRAMSKYLLGVADAIDEPFCIECGCFADQTEVTDEVAEPSEAAVAFTDGLADVVATIETKLDTVVAGVVKDLAEPTPSPAGGQTEAEAAFGQTITAAGLTPPPPAAAPAGVELDKDGLPWDARINTASKLKLKKEGTWKLTRNIDPTLVEQVRAELRAALDASPANPVLPVSTQGGAVPASSVSAEVGTSDVPPSQTAAPAPPAETAAPAPPAAVTPAPAASGSGGLITKPYPLFMRKATAAGLTPEAVLAAVNKAGLASIVMLATRPDLIPVVEAELFPGA